MVGNAFSQLVIASTKFTVRMRGKRLKGSACVVDLERSFTVLIDLSIIGTCSSWAQRWRFVGDNTSFSFLMLNSLSPCTSVMMKPRSLYFFLIIKSPLIICNADLL